MFKTTLFYKIYDKLFMNDYSDLVIELFRKKKIRVLSDKMIVFDVGSYKGTFSHNLEKKIKIKKKISFYLFDPLSKKIKNKIFSKNFKYFNFAFDKFGPGVKRFYVNNFLAASGSSLRGDSFKDQKYMFSRGLIGFFLDPFKKMFSIIKVKTNSLDNFCKTNKIKYINILKIDTEGTELDVLNGSQKMLKNIDLICVEIQCKKEIYQSRLNNINKLLKKDFNLYYKKRIPLASLFTGIISYDYIYIKKKYKLNSNILS